MSSLDRQFKIHFWGVRGSIACPGASTLRYGGNTPCVEMLAGETRLIFDAGTGIRVLGEKMNSQSPHHAHLFFSHSHWDHIQGFPFFGPGFVPGNQFDLYGAIAPTGERVEQRLIDQMRHPNFPVPLQIMNAELRFHDLQYQQKIKINDVTIQTGLLNHPGAAMGFRVEWQGWSAAYISDTEHYPDRLDDNVLRLIDGVDVMIYDSTYTDAEYTDPDDGKVGWGHSTWQEGVKLARAAQVKQLAIFHHDPSHDDEFMDGIAAAARASFSGAVVAQEGMEIVLGF
jgi:phosphoribosyl 1,2-cyclic phosphodiesterase